jgi:outer membrane lipopolysaccharide assembly protein LptE/RlpB
MKYHWITFLVCFSFISLFSCGYRFAGGGALPHGVQTVAVDIFENRTSETGIEGIISNDIIFEFTRNGRSFTTSKKRADAFLSGKIESIRTRSISRKSVHRAQERRVTMIIALKLSDIKGNLLWQSGSVSENEEYEVLEDKAATELNKRTAISALSKRLAEKVYYRMTDEF